MAVTNMKLYGIWTSGSEEDVSYLEFWQPLSSADGNRLCNFSRRYREKQFCEIILNLNQ